MSFFLCVATRSTCKENKDRGTLFLSLFVLGRRGAEEGDLLRRAASEQQEEDQGSLLIMQAAATTAWLASSCRCRHLG